MLLLRNADLYAPELVGRRDLLCGGGRVLAIAERLDPLGDSIPHEEIDLEEAKVVPGLVDAHVHVTGGGGEAGYTSRVPALRLEDVARAGVTTVVGLLGTDGTSRTMRELVARTYALREEGLSAWCWTGNYEVPVKTLTECVRDDLVFIEPIIGVGELAISDHRSSQPTLDEFLRVAADVHVGGMISGKAGVLHLHVGDGPRGLELIRKALADGELPARVFHPTHINRSPELFEQAKSLVRGRGSAPSPTIDLTAFAEQDVGDGLSAAGAIAEWKREGLPLAGLTCSSDGGGCMPHFDAEGRIERYGVGQCTTLLATIREAVGEHGLSLAELLPLFTSNVAALLRLPGKGRIAVGADADLLVLGAELSAQATLAGGRWLVLDGRAVVRGPFG
jgi:beta-aspartyl-dipeptidase (metallo-type)